MLRYMEKLLLLLQLVCRGVEFYFRRVWITFCMVRDLDEGCIESWMNVHADALL